MEKKVYEFRSVTADNFDIEDCEVLVNKTHKYVKHVFNCEDCKSWYVCVTVFGIDPGVVAFSCRYYTEDGCQYTDAFIPAYKDACAELGIEPIIGEDDEEEEEKTKSYAEDMFHSFCELINGLDYKQILEIREDGFEITGTENHSDGSREIYVMYNGVAMGITENTDCEISVDGYAATHDSYSDLHEFKFEPKTTYRPKVSMNELEELKTEYPNMIQKMKTNVYNAIDGAMDCIGSEKVKLDFSKSEPNSIRSFFFEHTNCFIEKDDGEWFLKSYYRNDEDVYHEIRIKELLLEEMLCVLKTLCDTPS